MTENQTSTPNEIQFDQAEFTQAQGARLSCGGCGGEITGTYFDAGGKIVCPQCRERIVAGQAGGGGLGRFLKAVLYGVPAAAVGSGIYYAVSALTGYEFGLVAIVIGLMVGAAVRAGSKHRGGWPYQTLAMLLTYLAIVSTYIPAIIQGIKDNKPADDKVVSQSSEDTRKPASGVQTAHPSKPVDQAMENTTVQEASVQPRNVSKTEVSPKPNPSFGLWLAAMAALLAIAMAAPFLMGLNNIMGLIIIAIGLYEAWKLNKRNPIIITGPFDLSTANAKPEPTHG